MTPQEKQSNSAILECEYEEADEISENKKKMIIELHRSMQKQTFVVNNYIICMKSFAKRFDMLKRNLKYGNRKFNTPKRKHKGKPQ